MSEQDDLVDDDSGAATRWEIRHAVIIIVVALLVIMLASLPLVFADLTE